VSDVFNGEWVCLSSEGNTIGDVNHFYDLKNKGSWQKLSLSASCTTGEVRVFLYFSKYGVSNFSSLKGNVIFAYPTVKLIRKNEDISASSADFMSEGIKIFTFRCERETNFDITKFIPMKFPDTTRERYILSFPIESREAQLISDYSSINSRKTIQFRELGIFNFPLTLPSNLFIDNEKDLVRKWSFDLVAEDTIYHGLKTLILSDSFSDELKGTRILRWKFAWEIFKIEYKLPQKIFGNGFNYLNWYGYYFLEDKTASDWPHNPFLSILLYSGIIGVLVYIIFIVQAFNIFIRYINEYSLLFVFFLITFFFSFFSGSSPFDPPVMGFFAILPFFIHSVLKKER
jgi:hypothetical protein